MVMQINLVREVSAYTHALDALIGPIQNHLPECTVSAKAGVDGALNFCFFLGSTAPSPRGLMSHGVADKNYIGRSKRGKAKNFDYLFVPGPAYKEKHVLGLGIEKFPKDRIFVVGWPKMDPLFSGEMVRKPATDGEIRVLYAPTHNAIKEVSSYPAFSKHLDKFPPGIRVINSPHPARKESRAATLHEWLEADVVIADSGSTIYEAWMLGLPVIFPDWLVKEGVLLKFAGSFEAKIYEQEIGFHAKTFKQLVNMIPAAYEQGVDDRVKEFMEGVCPARLNGKSGKTIAKYLRRIANHEV